MKRAIEDGGAGEGEGRAVEEGGEGGWGRGKRVGGAGGGVERGWEGREGAWKEGGRVSRLWALPSPAPGIYPHPCSPGVGT